MHAPLNVKLPRMFISRNVRPYIFRLVGLSFVSEDCKFMVTVTDYGICLVPLQQASSTEEHWCCDNAEIETFIVTF